MGFSTSVLSTFLLQIMKGPQHSTEGEKDLLPIQKRRDHKKVDTQDVDHCKARNTTIFMVFST
ncbi:hypothetical protein E2C01_049162 [Portunus trituberculatus]|uniref:Uncharacterized protein n=1 Tax=Portunus trituberculatus TaxID=210409 RepID=A0A5B7G4W8_PORTR|nr:hypothetical protein [Portunus trituberculatus]